MKGCRRSIVSHVLNNICSQYTAKTIRICILTGHNAALLLLSSALDNDIGIHVTCNHSHIREKLNQRSNWTYTRTHNSTVSLAIFESKDLSDRLKRKRSARMIIYYRGNQCFAAPRQCFAAPRRWRATPPEFPSASWFFSFYLLKPISTDPRSWNIVSPSEGKCTGK